MRTILSLIIIGTVILTSCKKKKDDPDYNPAPTTTITDADGNTYPFITIGTQVWMAENLKTTKYNDGTDITLVTDPTAWGNLTTAAYTWYGNNASNKNTYGGLYNWYAINSGKLCPAGWHVPTDGEWTTMENYLIANGYNYDGTTTGNKITKALSSTSGWTSSVTVGSPGNTDYSDYRNKSGFNALPGGYRYYTGAFNYATNTGYWWTATDNAGNPWIKAIYNNGTAVGSHNVNMKIGASCRCVKD